MTSGPISIEPVVSYPRTARPGERHYLTVDLQHRHPPEQWPYTQEELALTCLLRTSLFTHDPLGEQSIVLHRFGGSYGPAAFLLTAKEGLPKALQKGTITLNFVNRHGMTVHTVVLRDIEITAQPAPSVAPTLPVPIPAQGRKAPEKSKQPLAPPAEEGAPPPEEPSQVPDAGLLFEDSVPEHRRKEIREAVSKFQEYLVRNGIIEDRVAPLWIRGSSESPDVFWTDRHEMGLILFVGRILLKDSLLREYAHHILMPERVKTSEALAAVESGLADYLVCSFKNDPRFGTQEAQALDASAPFLRNLDNRLSLTRPPDPTASGLGEIWGGVFWELRQYFGAQVVDQLVTQAWRSEQKDFPRALLRRMAGRSFEKFEKTWEVLLARGAVGERELRTLLIEAIQPVELSLPPFSLRERPEVDYILQLVTNPYDPPTIRVEGYYGQASATLLRLVGLRGEQMNVPVQFFLFDVPSRLPPDLSPYEFLERFTASIEHVVRYPGHRPAERRVVVGICNYHRFHTSARSRQGSTHTPALDPKAVGLLQERLMRLGVRLVLACRPDTPRLRTAGQVRLQDLDADQVRSLCRMYGVELSDEGVQELLHWTGGSLHLAEIALQGSRQHKWSLEDLMRFESEEWSRIFDAEMVRVRDWLGQQSPHLAKALVELRSGRALALDRDIALPLMGQGLIRESERGRYTLRTPLYRRATEPEIIARLPRELRDRVGEHRWSVEAITIADPDEVPEGIRLALQSRDAKKDPLPKLVRFRLTPEIHETVQSDRGRASADFFFGALSVPSSTAYAEMDHQGQHYRLSIPLDVRTHHPEPEPPRPRKKDPQSLRKKSPKKTSKKSSIKRLLRKVRR